MNMTRMGSPVKKIAICHYRIGQTDGVSLEIIKRKKMLQEMGYLVKLISGTRQTGADCIIPELEFDRPKIALIKKNAFSGFELEDDERVYPDDDALLEDIHRVAGVIEKKFLKIHQKEKFDYLFLHNVFTHGRHIAAAKAFYAVAKKTDIQVVSFNHDFYESYEGLYTPRTPKIKTYLRTYVPPRLGKIRHVTINSLSRDLLFKKIGQKAIAFPDTFEFDQNPWVQDRYNQDLLKHFNIKANDLIFLQATRVVERKAIELAIDLITELNKRKQQLVGRKLYNGKRLDEQSEIVLAFGQFVEPASRGYRQKLIEKMKAQGVKYRDLSPRIAYKRMQKDGVKRYSLWDAYVFADVISYPSTWEGFGNQFLEAVFAKKPMVIFEYPVFTADIKDHGYAYISLGARFRRAPDGLKTIGRKRVKQAADATIRFLLDPRTRQIVNKNHHIAKDRHGEKALKKLLQRCLKPHSA